MGRPGRVYDNWFAPASNVLSMLLPFNGLCLSNVRRDYDTFGGAFDHFVGQVDAGMILSLLLAGVLLTASCVLMFVLVLDGEVFQDHSLAVLNAFLAYPIVTYGIFSVFQVRRASTAIHTLSSYALLS